MDVDKVWVKGRMSSTVAPEVVTPERAHVSNLPGNLRCCLSLGAEDHAWSQAYSQEPAYRDPVVSSGDMKRRELGGVPVTVRNGSRPTVADTSETRAYAYTVLMRQRGGQEKRIESGRLSDCRELMLVVDNVLAVLVSLLDEDLHTVRGESHLGPCMIGCSHTLVIPGNSRCRVRRERIEQRVF
jgi:hypothetical protein